MGAKVYIKYCRPFKDEKDYPPIEEVWCDGDRPKKRRMDHELLFVYDVVYDVANGSELINKRSWNGVE